MKVRRMHVRAKSCFTVPSFSSALTVRKSGGDQGGRRDPPYSIRAPYLLSSIRAPYSITFVPHLHLENVCHLRIIKWYYTKKRKIRTRVSGILVSHPSPDAYHTKLWQCHLGSLNLSLFIHAMVQLRA